MDETDTLFGTSSLESAVHTRRTGRAREEPTHVLFSTDDDFDLLGGDDLVKQPESDAFSVFSTADAQAAADGIATKGSSSLRDDGSLLSKDDDAWSFMDHVPMRPMGSSKLIEADDDDEFPDESFDAWTMSQRRSKMRSGDDASSSAASSSTQRGGSGGRGLSSSSTSARLPGTPSLSEPAAPTSNASKLMRLLLADAKWQLTSIRQRLRQQIRALRGIPMGGDKRRIVLNDASANVNDDFSSNQVMTNKYNLVTFVPVFLLEQFSKYANVFFLFIGCIQQIPGVSPTNRWTTLVPLGIVLLVAAAKEIAEDWRRYTSDMEMNARLVPVLVQDTWEPRAWRDVCVGDIVRVSRDEFFPADLVLLSSSEPEGLAYVETANLDGETNLKVKQALPATAPLTSAASVAALRGELTCEAPNNSLYTFDGTLQLPGHPPRPVGPDQLLLRGAQLRNAPWLYGLVVFTGNDTKLLQNATKTPIKRTRVEKHVNSLILSLFVLLLALSLISSIGSQIYLGSAPAYLMTQLDTRSGARQFVESVLTFIILYNSLIPISLIVSMDVVKLQLANLINSDLDLYYEPQDTPALCRRSNLVEDLGQIDYIFSDKTGTLTRNEMEFRQASIAGVAFADVVNDAPPGERYAWGDLREILARGDTLSHNVHTFLCVLAVCHTVIPEVRDGQVVFQASSPDEAALVAGAQALGYVFTTRKPRSVFIQVHGTELVYELLQVCEFNSARKRMSTVVREPDGRIVVYCKGADTVILPRLRPAQPHVDVTLQHLETYASDGLRTLCVACRTLEASEYQAWAQRYEAAAAELDGRQAALDAVAEELERDMDLLGATAIEDKLQEGVPDTIATLQTAGIHVWVLTGDRQETAINIGYSCRLISESMNLLIVNEAAAADTAAVIHQQLTTIEAHPDAINELALIVEGRSLQHALQAPVSDAFLRLASQCKAVMCCRVSPLQKALVVELVKANTGSVLLAIGDGANDVGMIQAAHVGVGISGHEGLQAARSADVSISQFRFLRKLLLVHGNWSYARLSKMVMYSFYKTVTLYVTLFWYSFYNGFSGQTAYESWSQSFYNVAFTMLPTLVIGIFDQYVSARMLERYPQLYHEPFFTGRAIGGWMINAVYHSIVNFFFVAYMFEAQTVKHDGYPGYQWLWGTTLYFSVLVTVLGKAALVSNLWTRYTLLAIPGSFGLTIVFFVVFATVAPALGVSMEYSFIVPRLLGLPRFWLIIIFVPILSLLRDLVWRYWQRTYRPKSYHIVQEMQKYQLQDVHPRTDEFRKYVAFILTLSQKHPQSPCCAAHAPVAWLCIFADRGRSGAPRAAIRHDQGSSCGPVNLPAILLADRF